MPYLLYVLGAALLGWSGVMLLRGDAFATLDIAASLAGYGVFAIGLGAVAHAVGRLARAISSAPRAARPRVAPALSEREEPARPAEPQPAPRRPAEVIPNPLEHAAPKPEPTAPKGVADTSAETPKRAQKHARKQDAADAPAPVTPAAPALESSAVPEAPPPADPEAAAPFEAPQVVAPSLGGAMARRLDRLSARREAREAPAPGAEEPQAEPAPKLAQPKLPRIADQDEPFGGPIVDPRRPRRPRDEPPAPEPAAKRSEPEAGPPALQPLFEGPAALRTTRDEAEVSPPELPAEIPALPVAPAGPPAPEPRVEPRAQPSEVKAPDWLLRARARREAKARTEADIAGRRASRAISPEPSPTSEPPPIAAAEAEAPAPFADLADDSEATPSSSRVVLREGEHNGVLYRFFEDGGVDAVSPHGARHFASVDELKATILAARGDGDGRPQPAADFGEAPGEAADPLDAAIAELEGGAEPAPREDRPLRASADDRLR